MTTYQLAKLAAIAGTFDSRKRVQKLVHLLQAAGCELSAEYRLHYYGPYSSEVAGLLDELSTLGVLSETPRPFAFGTQYRYDFNERFRERLDQYERTEAGKKAKVKIENVEPLIRRLCDVDLKQLELGSTMVYFRQAGREWDEAVRQTCAFKNQLRDCEDVRAAEQLARQVMSFECNGHNGQDTP